MQNHDFKRLITLFGLSMFTSFAFAAVEITSMDQPIICEFVASQGNLRV